MISASDELKEYINNTSRDTRQYIKVEIIVGEPNDDDNILEFKLEDMIQGSLKVTRRAVGSNNFDIGQSYIDEAVFTLDRAVLEDVYEDSLIGKTCIIYYGVDDITPGVDEQVKIFTGIIPQAGITKTIKTVEIHLDSFLALFNVPILGLTSGTPKVLVNYALTQVGMQMTVRLQSLLDSHPNNQYTFFIAEEGTIVTYLDLLMWLSQILSCAFTCNNEGKLDAVIYDNTAVPYELNSNICKSSSVSEDYEFFNACSIVIDNTETKIIGTATDTNVLQLSDNPLIVGIQDEVLRDIIITNIYNTLADVPLRAFSYAYNGNPLLELGDRIKYNNVSTFIQSIEYGFRKLSKVEGYTIDNRLNQTSQSIRSANHSGGGGGTGTDTIGILKWVLPERKLLYTNREVLVAEEYVNLYANTKALLTTSFNMYIALPIANDFVVIIKQYWDNVEQPMVIRKTVRVGADGWIPVSFNIVAPESDMYETHQYRITISVSNIAIGIEYTGQVDAYELETDIIGFMTAGGQPTFSGAYFCEDRVNLNTTVVDMPVTELGTIEDSVNVSI